MQAEDAVLRLDVGADFLVRQKIEKRIVFAAKVGVAAVRAVQVRVALAASDAGAGANGRLGGKKGQRNKHHAPLPQSVIVGQNPTPGAKVGVLGRVRVFPPICMLGTRARTRVASSKIGNQR